MMKRERIAALISAVMLVLAASATRAGDEQKSAFENSVALEAEQKYEEALEVLDRATGPNTHSYIVELRRGWLYYLMGKHAASVTAYRRAIRLETGSMEARLAIMLPQMAQRKWIDAEKSGLAATKLAPDNYLANSRLAYTYYNLTRFKEASTYYAKVLKRYPGDLEMRSGYAWSLFKLGHYEKAKTEFRKILAIMPNYHSALEGISLCP